MREKFCMSYSLGKDSSLALYNMIQKGNIPVALIVSVNEDKRSWFHGIDNVFIKKTQNSLNIPVILAKGNGHNYKEAFIEAIEKAKKLGATTVAFGDIDIEDHKIWCTNVCNEANVSPTFPLWQQNRKDIVNQFLNAGFKAIIKTVSKEHKLSKDFLGQVLNKDLINTFEKLGIDACGENGEYHTFVYDGPTFSEEIKFTTNDIYESEYSYSIILGTTNE